MSRAQEFKKEKLRASIKIDKDHKQTCVLELLGCREQDHRNRVHTVLEQNRSFRRLERASSEVAHKCLIGSEER